VSFDALRSAAAASAAVSVFVSSERQGTAGRADRQVLAVLTSACQRALVAATAAAAAAAAADRQPCTSACRRRSVLPVCR